MCRTQDDCKVLPPSGICPNPSFPRKRESTIPALESCHLRGRRRESNNFAIILVSDSGQSRLKFLSTVPIRNADERHILRRVKAISLALGIPQAFKSPPFNRLGVSPTSWKSLGFARYELRRDCPGVGLRTIAKSSHTVEYAPTRLSRGRTSPSRKRGRESTGPTPAFAGAGSWSPAISQDDGANRTTLQSSCPLCRDTPPPPADLSWHILYSLSH